MFLFHLLKILKNMMEISTFILSITRILNIEISMFLLRITCQGNMENSMFFSHIKCKRT